jgi:ATP-dependent metalloprotease
MVTKFGMSDKLGNVDLDSNHNRLSSETKRLIESEVRRTIEEARVRATDLLKSKSTELELLAKALVNYETLNSEEAYKVVRGEKLVGKLIAPSTGSIKLPETTGTGTGGLGGLGDINGVPPIPGSKEADGRGGDTGAGESEGSPPRPAGGMAA